MERYLLKMSGFSIKSENNICFIHFSDHSSKNAMSLAFAAAMKNIVSIKTDTQKTIFENFLQEEKVFLVVVQSLVENIFSSGGHLHDLLHADKHEHPNYTDSIHAFCQLLSSISMPSIAVLSGHAYGGGVELALAPDFRWSIGKNIEFHFVQTRLGVPGGWGGMTRLTELNPVLNTKKVSSIFMAQDVFSFQDLVQLSLIDKQFDSEKSCFSTLFKWRDSIATCDAQLRKDFFYRNKTSTTELEEYDRHFFKKYFLSENHKKNIQNYFDRRGKK